MYTKFPIHCLTISSQITSATCCFSPQEALDSSSSNKLLSLLRINPQLPAEPKTPVPQLETSGNLCVYNALKVYVRI